MSISKNDLPRAVKETLRRDYKGAEVMHAFEITSTGETMYEVEVKMDEDHEMMEEEEHEEMEEQEENEEHGEMEENEEYDHEDAIRELVFTKDGKVVHKKEMKEEND